ncbi:MAG: phosphate transport system regulatory protein PhoU [Ignavibacteriae bacterium HGW-Ignavibacteriae-3]|nr:MAG: phosphate transport system regulatory protein PhoU [Ignavibacteriae bacterium HGW-Ignavibacteriae-3]
MRENFQKEIEELKSNLIKMASIVDDQVENAFNALESGDIEICSGIKSKDIEIDAFDNLIQTQCENILALFQPVAGDLRFIIAAMMVNSQLERCGDIAVNICQRVRKTGDHHQLIVEAEILEMGRQAKDMIRNAIDSFIGNNVELAKNVLTADDRVDDLNKQIFNFLVSKMQIDSSLVEPCSHLIVLTRNIERLADHATNIAEDVLFFVEAILISHKKKLLRYYKSSVEPGEVT